MKWVDLGWLETPNQLRSHLCLHQAKGEKSSWADLNQAACPLAALTGKTGSAWGKVVYC